MSSTVVTTNKIIELSECNLESKTLLTGTLLKWIDVIACLSAEKHANAPCVTASVDDLQLQRSIKLGHVLVMKAWVNRAFNTSMEIEVCVSTEDTTTLEHSKICQAFFTFVTQPNENGNKPLVEAITPQSEEEKTQYKLANERKKMRLEYRDYLKKIDNEMDEAIDPFEDNSIVLLENGIDPKTTCCESVEIVLPQHANHHQTTFGGQLMAWMEATCTISARRLSRNTPRLVAVDEVFFRAPSKVGDRIVIRSCVNNTYGKSMEVGVSVDAYAVGGASRHIQSAYLTFIAFDQNGNPIELPKVIATSKKMHLRMQKADFRKKMRTDRRSILCSNGVSVPLTEYNQNVLSYKNIICLMELYNSSCFTFKIQIDDIRLYQCKIDGVLCIRIECEVDAPPECVYKLLSDHKKRKYWDMFVTDVKIEREIRCGEDHILHYTMQNLRSLDNELGDDFVVLASTRNHSNGNYLIAYRSVTVRELPPVAEYHRSENKCSGFVIEPCRSVQMFNGCKLTYVNQLTDHVYEYVKQDLKGATDSFAKRAIALKELIVKANEQDHV